MVTFHLYRRGRFPIYTYIYIYMIIYGWIYESTCLPWNNNGNDMYVMIMIPNQFLPLGYQYGRLGNCQFSSKKHVLQHTDVPVFGILRHASQVRYQWRVQGGAPKIANLWLSNIAMENGQFIDDFPINTSICKGFSMFMLNNQRVTQCYKTTCKGGALHCTVLG